jgi:hypothetical protein
MNQKDKNCSSEGAYILGGLTDYKQDTQTI